MSTQGNPSSCRTSQVDFATSANWHRCWLTQTGFVRLSLKPQIVGVSLDCQAALNLLQILVDHPHHHDAEAAPALTATSFGELVPNLKDYRQVPDATWLHLTRVHGIKLITFDRTIAAICPWPEHLELLTP